MNLYNYLKALKGPEHMGQLPLCHVLWEALGIQRGARIGRVLLHLHGGWLDDRSTCTQSGTSEWPENEYHC